MGADEVRYALHNYGHLMTFKEKPAFSHLGGTMNAIFGRNDRAQEEVKPDQHVRASFCRTTLRFCFWRVMATMDSYCRPDRQS